MSGQKIDNETALLAAIADRLSMLVWFQTKDGQKNRNRPYSILARLICEEQKENDKDFQVFRTPEEFEAARRRALNREV